MSFRHLLSLGTGLRLDHSMLDDVYRKNPVDHLQVVCLYFCQRGYNDFQKNATEPRK